MTTASSSLNQEFEEVKRLEESYLRVASSLHRFKVPIEQARRLFRGELKLADKELIILLGAVRNLPSKISLDNERRFKLVEKLQAIRTKLCELKAKRELFLNRGKSRIRELERFSTSIGLDLEGGQGGCWQRKKILRLIAEYMLINNHSQAAKILIEQNFLGANDCDVELYSECKTVVESLLGKTAVDCLAWCAENRAYLKRKNSPLEFLLRRQEFVETLKQGNYGSAVVYAKKYFPSFMDEYGPEVEQALAMLSINPLTNSAPYKWLYDDQRWRDLSLLFRLELCSLYSLPNQSQLESVLLCGISSLKTRHCVSTLNNEYCPVCSGPLSLLCEKVPFSHNENSVLVCPISGIIMDNSVVPLVTPDGMVISSEATSTLRSDDRIIMPNKAIYKVQELRKCFIS